MTIDEFKDLWVSYGLIVRCPFETIYKIKELLTRDDIKFVFDKVSTGKMFITDDDPQEPINEEN